MRLCKGVPKTHIYKAIRGGEVRVNKGRISVDYRIAEGDMVRIPPLRLPDPGKPKPVPAAEFPVVFEDDAMLVVDKPAGVAVHGGSGVSFGVIEQLRAADVKVIFSELNFPSAYVETIQRETGVKLYALSHISYGEYSAEQFEKEMTQNLATVVRAIEEAGA